MAYTQKPGRGNSSKTGSGIPSPLLQDKNPQSGEKTKPLPADISSSKSGSTTTSTSTYGSKAATAIKNASGLELTPEGMKTFAPSSSTSTTDLNLGKYKDYLSKGSPTNSKSGQNISTYKSVKGRVMNPAHLNEIKKYVKDLNPGKSVNLYN
jgi:hypothetical protein